MLKIFITSLPLMAVGGASLMLTGALTKVPATQVGVQLLAE